MSERLSLASKSSVTKTLEDGTTVTAEKIENDRPAPGDRAFHEAHHAVVADKFNYSTINPNGDALGSTQPVEMTAMAAAAAAAMGHDGIGWDKHIVEDILDADWNAAKSGARAYLSGKEDLALELATRLQEKGTIGQPDMEEAKQSVKDVRNGIIPAKVTTIEPGGKTVTYITKTLPEGVIYLPSNRTPTLKAEIIKFPSDSTSNEFKIHESLIPAKKDEAKIIQFPTNSSGAVDNAGSTTVIKKAA